MSTELHRERNAHDPPTGAQILPGPVPREAIAYWEDKQLTPRIGFDYRDVWGEEHAVAFTVARVTRHDVLAAIRLDIDAAIRNGVPVEEFIRNLQPRLVQLGWWGEKNTIDPITGQSVSYEVTPRRLRNIFDTNMRQARAAGQWDRIQRAKESRPYLLYQLGPSHHHRDQHVAWAGTLLPVDHPFWLTHMPINGWGCKCHVRQVTQAEADRLGGATPPPDTSTEPWLNERTGETYHVPVGIDPGFEYNAGVSRANNALRAPMQQRAIAWQPGAEEDYRRIVAAPASEEALALSERWRTRWLGDSTDARAGIGPLLVGSSRPYRVDIVGGVYQTPIEHLRIFLEGSETIPLALEAAAYRYGTTQAALASENVSVVQVWRGLHSPQDREVREAIAAGAQRIRVGVRPLVSAAATLRDAMDFAEDYGGGYVLRLSVAASRVFTHPSAKLGLEGESEVVLLNPEGWIDVDIEDVIEVKHNED